MFVFCWSNKNEMKREKKPVSELNFQMPRFNEGGWPALSLADLLFHQLNSQCAHLELSRLRGGLFLEVNNCPRWDLNSRPQDS